MPSYAKLYATTKIVGATRPLEIVKANEDRGAEIMPRLKLKRHRPNADYDISLAIDIPTFQGVERPTPIPSSRDRESCFLL